MGRWIAIGRKPAWQDAGAFSTELRKVDTWRPDARTTITTVTVLEDGRMLVECHAPKLEQFRAWLDTHGWEDYTCTPVTQVARTGSVWKVS